MKNAPHSARQRGIVLVVGLVFLLVLTILGVTALRTTTLEERMAGNLMAKTYAFQDVEAAIARFLMNLNPTAQNFNPLSTTLSCSAAEARNDLSNNDPNRITNTTCPRFLGNTPVPRLTDTAYGPGNSYNHFRIESQSQTAGNAVVLIHQGIAQFGPDYPVESEPPTP